MGPIESGEASTLPRIVLWEPIVMIVPGGPLTAISDQFFELLYGISETDTMSLESPHESSIF